tara:strand:+ start:223 stop:1206 length:984 start_codon:yes stop_codon:yes gene_type:complete
VTTYNTSRPTSKSTTTTYNTSKSTVTTWTTAWTTSWATSHSTSKSTTTSYSTQFNTTRATGTSWTGYVSTSRDTSRPTSRNTTTTWTTSWVTKRETAYSQSTLTSWNSSYTTVWITSSSTSQLQTGTSRTTYFYKNTSRNTSRSTDDGGGACIVAGTPVHVSLTETKLIENLIITEPVLTLDGAFNVEDQTTLSSVSTTSVDNTLSTDDILAGVMTSYAIGIIDINNGLLKSSSSHQHIVKRSGLWKTSLANQLVVGDILWHITNGEIPITSISHDTENQYTIYKLDIEPNDTFFANGILTHNKKIECDVCDPGSDCYAGFDPSCFQ